MNSRWWRWGPIVGLVGATACSGGPAPETTRFEIKAAALTLTGISDALYTINVQNQQGRLRRRKGLDVVRGATHLARSGCFEGRPDVLRMPEDGRRG